MLHKWASNYQSLCSSYPRTPIPCPVESLLWSWWYCPLIGWYCPFNSNFQQCFFFFQPIWCLLILRTIGHSPTWQWRLFRRQREHLTEIIWTSSWSCLHDNRWYNILREVKITQNPIKTYLKGRYNIGNDQIMKLLSKQLLCVKLVQVSIILRNYFDCRVYIFGSKLPFCKTFFSKIWAPIVMKFSQVGFMKYVL